MKKMMLILIVTVVLLSGCISVTNSKSGINKTSNNGDEYGNDNSVEEDDSGVVQAEYNSLDLNNKNSKISNNQSTIYENTTIKR